MTELKIAGVVLAGGGSRRMGQDKALLELQGQTLLRRNFELFKQIRGCTPWVSGDYPEYPCIADMQQGFGPLGGMHACMAALDAAADAVLFLPVDMPHIQPPLLQQLISAWQTQPSDYYFRDSLFPLLLRSGMGHEQRLMARLNAGQLPVKGFLKAIDANALNVDGQWRNQILNTNTPTQWEQAQQLIKE